MNMLRKITIEGYKSIRQMSLELRPLNVLIGANGAGKSNFVSFFELLREIAAVRLQHHVARSGGGDAFLFYGAKDTPRLSAMLDFEGEIGAIAFSFTLASTPEDTLFFERESLEWAPSEGTVVNQKKVVFNPRTGLSESALLNAPDEVREPAHAVWNVLRQCRVFHFRDTSNESHIRRSAYIHDNRWLDSDGGNLASVLYRSKKRQPHAYQRTILTLQQIMPWFRDFVLQPLELSPENVNLDWHERDSDHLFGAHQLPDGALRAMALVTLLLQPKEFLPSIIVIDEPELGLHPSAINVVAGLAAAASHQCQVILATQSVNLLDQFDPEDVIVVDREGGSSTFKRVPEQMSPELLKEWLDDYSLSELWEKNVIGGGPF